MNYYFIKYKTKESLVKGLKTRGLIEKIEGEDVVVNGTSIDYIGDIPKATDKEGNVTEWVGGFHANIVTDKTLSFGSNAQTPKSPYHIFAGYQSPIEE
jgi:hypothetical protein